MPFGQDPRPNETYAGHYRIFGQLSGDSLTIGNGESKQYTLTFPHDSNWDPEVCVGMNCATQAQAKTGDYNANAAFYDSNGVSNTFKNIPSSCTFANNATWTLVIGSDTVRT